MTVGNAVRYSRAGTVCHWLRCVDVYAEVHTLGTDALADVIVR